eukprot:GHRR01024079.1.p1 GENE.GHRR01024079.1~~GHRR01024079.1.p1  ORF type:complete len:388 (+),score=129.30 GHRR01024079.1:937-2100(+)
MTQPSQQGAVCSHSGDLMIAANKGVNSGWLVPLSTGICYIGKQGTFMPKSSISKVVFHRTGASSSTFDITVNRRASAGGGDAAQSFDLGQIDAAELNKLQGYFMAQHIKVSLECQNVDCSGGVFHFWVPRGLGVRRGRGRLTCTGSNWVVAFSGCLQTKLHQQALPSVTGLRAGSQAFEWPDNTHQSHLAPWPLLAYHNLPELLVVCCLHVLECKQPEKPQAEKTATAVLQRLLQTMLVLMALICFKVATANTSLGLVSCCSVIGALQIGTDDDDTDDDVGGTAAGGSAGATDTAAAATAADDDSDDQDDEDFDPKAAPDHHNEEQPQSKKRKCSHGGGAADSGGASDEDVEDEGMSKEAAEYEGSDDDSSDASLVDENSLDDEDDE